MTKQQNPWDRMIAFCEAAMCSPDSPLTAAQMAERYGKYNPRKRKMTLDAVESLLAEGWAEIRGKGVTIATVPLSALTSTSQDTDSYSESENDD